MPRRCYEERAVPSSDPFEKGLFSIWGRQLPVWEKENAWEPSRFYNSCWLLFGLDGPGCSFLRASSGVLTDIPPLPYPQHRPPAWREVGWARLSFLSFPLGLGIHGHHVLHVKPTSVGTGKHGGAFGLSSVLWCSATWFVILTSLHLTITWADCFPQ